MYYNYHAKAKQLIRQNHLIDFQIFDNWNNISPALVLFFDNHKPMPIRQKRWEEYQNLLSKFNQTCNKYQDYKEFD